MDAIEVDRVVRAMTFEFLDRESVRHGGVFPRSVLSRGFDFAGTRVPLVGPQGIFKPAVLQAGMPLTITTAPATGGRRPYDDEVGDDGVIRYRYRGTDPLHHENVGLRRARDTQTPLVYLVGIDRGFYVPRWPAFITGDDAATLSFTLAVDDPRVLRPDLPQVAVDEAQRRYVTRLAKFRVHQLAFRHRVMQAYRTSCAVCRLRRGEMLDAAHIVADTHPLGTPVVPNGLALCKLHHAAFDSNVMGIRPDLVVEIRQDVLDEVDGPMLLHGLQDFQGSRLLVVPRAKPDQPSPELLEIRYEEFRRAG